MYTFEHLQLKKSPSISGWYLKLSTVKELIEHTQKVDPTRIEVAFTDYLSAEVEKRTHFSDMLAANCSLLAEIKGTTFVDTIFNTLTGSFKYKLEKIIKGYNVFINPSGGYTFDTTTYESYVVLETITKKGLIYPMKDIKDVRYIKWPQGTHWYAKIGNIDIVDDRGSQKWDTKKEAEKAAKIFLQRM